MKNTARGSFTVKSSPLPTNEALAELGAMSLKFTKVFCGDLVATSTVVMIGTMNSEAGSGAYVALEQIKGALADREGTFELQHSSSMNKGEDRQSITVVPGSGTAGLAGLDGSMSIDIKDGQHFYTFFYEFRAS